MPMRPVAPRAWALCFSSATQSSKEWSLTPSTLAYTTPSSIAPFGRSGSVLTCISICGCAACVGWDMASPVRVVYERLRESTSVAFVHVVEHQQRLLERLSADGDGTAERMAQDQATVEQ